MRPCRALLRKIPAHEDHAALAILQRNLLIYGFGGIIVPFIGIKLIDLVITTLRLA